MRDDSYSLMGAFVRLPFMLVALTQTEIADTPRAAAIALVIRGGALGVLVGLFVSTRLPVRDLGISATVGAYFFALNATSLTPTVVLTLLFIVSALVLSSALNASQSARHEFTRLLGLYNGLHLSGLLLSIVLVFGFGQAVDLHAILFPYSAAHEATHLGFTRLSGFHIEPGTYANSTFVVVLMRSTLRGRVYSRLDGVAMLSSLATLSAWAVIGVAAYVSAAALEGTVTRSKRTVSIPTALILGLCVTSSILAASDSLGGVDEIQYLLGRFAGGDNSGSTYTKELTFVAWLAALDAGTLIGSPISQPFCRACESPQDLGAGFNLIYYFGALASSILLVGCGARLYKRRGIAVALLALPLLVSKLFFWDAGVWLVIGLGLFSAHGRPRDIFNANRDSSRLAY